MKSYFFLLIFSISILCSCTQGDQSSTLHVKHADAGNSELVVFNILDDVSHNIEGEMDSLQLDIDKETLLTFNVGWSHSYVHVKPGEQLSVDTLSSAPLVYGVTDNPSKENEYLTSFWNVNKSISEDFDMRETTKLPLDSFLMAVDQKNVPLVELITKIKADPDVSDYFKNAMDTRLAGLITNDLSPYKSFYNYHHEVEPEIPEDYYNAFTSHDVKNPSYLLFEDGRRAVSAYHSMDLKYDEFPSLTDFYKASIDSANELYGGSESSQYCNMELLSNMINFGGGLDEAAEMVEDFKSNTTNQYLNNKLEKTVAPWRALVSGKSAPDFQAMTRDGEPVKLSELKGKKVYVDVWATWCGPCIAEIPSLKKLEKDLHDENIEFVSVSIDSEKDKEKWKNYVQEKELTGTQLMAEGDWKSDVATEYNIKGIPRFLLIDAEGMIVSANAPRPSSDIIKETLLN